MKKFRKYTALLLTLAMCFALSVSAFATGTSAEAKLMAAVMAADDYEVSYPADGIRVTTATVPVELLRAVNADTRSFMLYSGTATLSRPGGFPFTCSNGGGSRCRITVENVDTTARLLATHTYILNGEDVLVRHEISAGNGRYMLIEDTAGNDLVLKIATEITPMNNAASVKWKAEATQY